MRLLHLAPAVALRDCGTCKNFMYDETTGKQVLRRNEPVPRVGEPPCRLSTGCPKGVPAGEKGCRELSPKNWLAYRHYQECKAVGEFPRDATVRRNAGLIAMAEDSAAKAADRQALGPLLSLFKGRA